MPGPVRERANAPAPPRPPRLDRERVREVVITAAGFAIALIVLGGAIAGLLILAKANTGPACPNCAQTQQYTSAPASSP